MEPLELRLFETKRKAPKLFGVGLTALAAHVGVIGAAVYATMAARPSDTTVHLDTTVVLLTPQQPKTPPPETPLAEPLRGFQTVTIPSVIPATIPKVDLTEHFDPKDYTGVGVEGGRANGVVPTEDAVYAETLVEEKPALLSAPQPAYPELLKQARIQGRVLLRAIVDTSGRAEPSSIEVAASPNPAFNAPARDWILKALFRPARLHGKAVRVHITLPIDYSITSG